MATKKTVVKEKKPTLRQKIATQKLVENGGNISRAMIEAGYSPQTAKTPQKLTESLGFQYYFSTFGLTDEAIAANVARIALTAKKRDQYSGEYDDDNHMQLKATELAIKVMGKMPKDTPDTNVLVVQPIIGGMSNAVLVDDSNETVVEVKEENTSSPGGDVSVQDDIDSLVSD